MNSPRRIGRPIGAGLLAGAAGAVLASLLSLPLKSPDDIIANTLTVTIVGLLLGGLFGVLWQRLQGDPAGRRKLLTYAGIGLAAAFVLLVILETAVLDRFISFGVPLAAILFAAVGVLPPLFTDFELPNWAPAAGVVVALALGGALAGIGDAESGDLSLDDLATPATTAPPTTTTSAPAEGSSTTAPPATTEAPSGVLAIPADLAATTFAFTEGTATWSVPETFVDGAVEAVGVGRSEQLAGTVDLTGASEISVDLTTFVSDQSRRDNRVRRLFESDPIATFTTSELSLPADYTEGDVFATDVTGELTVNSVTRSVTWSVEARLVGNQLDVTGELDIVLTDFDVTPPSIGGFVVVEDEARLEVLFSAIG